MSIVEGGPQRVALARRVRNILVRPTPEWEVIDHEPATVRGLYLGYAAPLAAIGPVCGLIGSLVFGYGFFGITFRPNLVAALLGAAVEYGLSLAMVYVLALAIDALAPSFGARRDRVQAFKVAVYACTAAWLAGAVGLVPAAWPLGVVGIYSLYLCYVGLPTLMKPPEEKRLPYAGVTLLIGAILWFLVGIVALPITRIGLVPPPGAPPRGQISVPGGKVDLGELDAAAKSIEAQVKAGREGDPLEPAASGDELQTLLPAKIEGYARTEIENSTGGAGPLALAAAKATYVLEGSRIELEITDLGAIGAAAGAFKVRAAKETATGYRKVDTKDGRLTTEEYDRQTHRGRYAVVIGKRFAVQAQGTGVTVGDLKAAVEAVDASRLEAMAKG